MNARKLQPFTSVIDLIRIIMFKEEGRMKWHAYNAMLFFLSSSRGRVRREIQKKNEKKRKSLTDWQEVLLKLCMHGPLGLRFYLTSGKIIVVGSVCWKGQAARCSSCIHIHIVRFIRWQSRHKRKIATGQISRLWQMLANILPEASLSPRQGPTRP